MLRFTHQRNPTKAIMGAIRIKLNRIKNPLTNQPKPIAPNNQNIPTRVSQKLMPERLNWKGLGLFWFTSVSSLASWKIARSWLVNLAPAVAVNITTVWHTHRAVATVILDASLTDAAEIVLLCLGIRLESWPCPIPTLFIFLAAFSSRFCSIPQFKHRTDRTFKSSLPKKLGIKPRPSLIKESPSL